ncbi:RHS repeat protein [Azoarcus sp. L1K30]|uniref:RHS repeat-associated core domain-containing protein n=1 Tax=Azoarcus sp. L1K30 TaxID=2820277 RepID=UPI001B818027|nr:RHS repeat-associated core domain-containing protein [Azoarcus sp. L1K30]MBR0566538.1 RHS repeat protein [Azoarcus sp. L1K30]
MSGKPAARIGDAVAKGKIVTGSATVLIGDAAEGAADRCPTCEPLVGQPVNPIVGAKLLPAETDFALPAPAVFAFTRSYASNDERVGVLGPGWSVPGEALGLEVTDQRTVLIDGQGRRLTFGPLAPGEARFSPTEGLWIRRGGPLIPQVDAFSQWEGRWRHIPEALQHARDAIFVSRGTNMLYFAREGAAWHLAAVLDINGYRTDFDWCGQGWPVAVRDSAGRRYVFVYVMMGEARRLRGVVLAGHDGPYTDDVDLHDPGIDWLVRYDYDSAARLVAVRDRDGQCAREFEWQGSVISAHRQPGGVEVRYLWDEPGPRGRVLRQSEGDGLTRSFAYHAGRTVVSDSLGRADTYHFEGEGADTRWVAHTCADGSQVRFHYDGFGRRVGTTDPLGRTSWLRRDGQGRLIARQEADGSTWQYRLDGDTGEALEIRNPAGLTWTIERDSRANPIAITGPDGATTRYAYADPRLPDRPTTITDARGGVRRLEWNALGQLIAHTDCSGHTTRRSFDAEGRLTAERNALGETIHYRYDRPGRVIETRRADDIHTAFAYDVLGRLVRITQADGRADTFDWDRFGRLTAHTNALGHTQCYRYDEAGRLTELTNENGAVSRFVYDAMDRLVEERGFDARTQRYAYDEAGQLIARTELSLPGAPTIRYVRDAAGRLTARHLPATEHAPACTETFRWRPDGSLAGFASPGAEVAFGFDAGGRPVRETQSHADGWSYTAAHRFGALGQFEASTLGDAPTLEWLSYGPGHLHGVRVPGLAVDFERDPLHREIERIVRPSEGVGATLVEARGYTRTGQLASSRLIPIVGGAEAAPRVRAYHYDALAQLVAITDPAHPEHNIAYAYDGAGRLVASRNSAAERHYRFDPAGNRTDPVQQRCRLSEAEWAVVVRERLSDPEFNPLAELGLDTPADPRWQDNRIARLAGISSRFDAVGNLVERSYPDGTRLTLGYDGAHRPVRLERVQPDGNRTIARYAYDARSRRIAKTVEGPDGVARLTRYGWDGERLVCEATDTATTTIVYEPASFVPLLRIEQAHHAQDAEGDDDEDARETRALLAHAAQLLAHHGLSMPDALRPGPAPARVSVFFTDHLGTPLRLTDAHGRTEWQARPDDWRAVTDPQGDIRQPIRFQGQWEDEESGFYYNRYRYYDPEQGRYVTQDPIGAIGGLNLYTYTANPLARLDPLGLSDAFYPYDIEPYQRPAKRPDGFEWGAGCGDAATDQYVPDSFGKADFFRACSKHDECYGTFGSDKNACDDALETNMKAACDQDLLGLHVIYKPLCKGVGSFYRLVLKDMNLGQPAFDAAQEEAFWKMIDERMRTW